MINMNGVGRGRTSLWVHVAWLNIVRNNSDKMRHQREERRGMSGVLNQILHKDFP